MKEIARWGDRVVVITSDSNQLSCPPILNRPYMHQSIDGLDLWWIRTIKYTAAKSIRRILSWIDFEIRLFRMPKNDLPRPDAIVVSSLSLLTILNGFLLRQRYGCRLAFEVRDIWPLTLLYEGGFNRKNPVIMGLALIEYLGYKYADIVVGTMPNLREHVAKTLGYDRPVACVPMGVDPTLLESDNSATLDRSISTLFPQGKTIVAYAGSIGISNALGTIFECAELLTNRTDIHFLFFGDGDLRAIYQQRYGNMPNVTFHDKVPKNMVLPVLSRCSILCFSTHVSDVWRYGQSLNKVVDYMLSGKPIIASYTGFPSMINEADCGRFVPAGDASALCQEISRMASLSSETLSQIGQRGRKWILEHRNYQALARDYRALLFPAIGSVKARHYRHTQHRGRI